MGFWRSATDHVIPHCGAIIEAAVFLGLKALPDPRQAVKVAYPLYEFLLLSLLAVLAVLAVLAGAEAFTDTARFYDQNLALRRRFRPFLDGTPPHERTRLFNAVGFRAI